MRTIIHSTYYDINIKTYYRFISYLKKDIKKTWGIDDNMCKKIYKEIDEINSIDELIKIIQKYSVFTKYGAVVLLLESCLSQNKH